MNTRYREFPAPASLAEFVHCFWTFEGDATDEPQRVAPDGRCELILHFGEPYLELTADGWRPQPRALFAGQLTRPLCLRGVGRSDVFGVRFRTAAAGAYVGRSVADFTDRRVAWEVRELDRARTAAPRLKRITAHLLARLNADMLDDSVSRCVQELRAHDGRTPLADLVANAGVGERTLQRRFQQAVGLAPRTLASILRFRRVFDALHAPDVSSWTDAAQAAGFFDHPQMTREFRRFVGCTPSGFLRQRRGLATSLANV